MCPTSIFLTRLQNSLVFDLCSHNYQKHPPVTFSSHLFPPVFPTAFFKRGHQNYPCSGTGCSRGKQKEVFHPCPFTQGHKLLGRVSELEQALRLVISNLFSQCILCSCLSNFCSSANGCTFTHQHIIYHTKYSNKWLHYRSVTKPLELKMHHWVEKKSALFSVTTSSSRWMVPNPLLVEHKPCSFCPCRISLCEQLHTFSNKHYPIISCSSRSKC